MTTLLLSAGDASGDAAASDLVAALRALDPTLRILALGGVELEKRGVEIVAEQRELAIGGLFELLPSLHRIVSVWRRMCAALERERPDVVVLIDSSGFNLPFARRARAAGAATLCYIAPQVWAWRPARIRKLAARSDRLAAILPFEADCYTGTGLRVDFVGHPLVDRVKAHGIGRADARKRLGLDSASRVLALLPGSRRNELRHGLGVQLAAAREIARRHLETRFVVPVAPSLELREFEAELRRADPGRTLPVDLVSGDSLAVIAASDVVVAKPGSATLEAVLLDRPLVVVGRVHPATAAIVRRLLRVERLALPNLIAGRGVVPEFLQSDTDPRAIADAVLALFEGPAREAQRAAFAEIRVALGPGGAAERTAAIAKELLDARARA